MTHLWRRQAALDLLGGDQVFQCTADTFEERDSARTGAQEWLAFCQLVQIHLYVITMNGTFVEWNQNVPRLRQRTVIGVDHDDRPLHGN